jgi:2-C-methyl-D-erythritol 4-phosphate cytidylyltransferase
VHRRPKVWAIVVGGGSGARFGTLKQFEPLGSQRVIDWACHVAESACDGVVVVVPAAHAQQEQAIVGGASRSDSVRRGLAAVPHDVDVVCVHDAARPFATVELFQRVIAAVVNGADAAVPGVAVADTIKEIDADGVVVATPPRDRLVAVQTPQAFNAIVLRAAHAGHGDGTDDAALVEAAGGRVVVVPGEPLNRKVTLPDDLDWARSVVSARNVGSARNSEGQV